MPPRYAKRGYKKAPYRKGQGKSVMKMVRSMMPKKEYKFIDVESAAAAQTYNGTITLISGVAQGTTAITRVGRSINLKSLLFRYSIIGLATDPIMRVMILYDKQNTGTAPSVGGILQTVGNANAVNAPLEYTQAGRFQILYDKLIVCDAVKQTSYEGKFYKKFNGLSLKYQGDTAAQADVNKNAIYVLTISTTAAGNPTIGWVSRLRFCDD